MTVHRWIESKLTLLAFWDVRGEHPRELAARMAETLVGFDAAIGDTAMWTTSDEVELALDADALEPVISAGVYVDDGGQVFPNQGYQISAHRRGASMTLLARVRAGSSEPARRRPSNEIILDILPGTSGTPSADQVDRVALTVAHAWEPASLAVRDSELVAAEATRGRWDPLVGWRTWVSHDLGSIRDTADGVRAELTPGGTFLAVDGVFSSQEAVAAVRATFERNGIGEMPHATPAPQVPRPQPS
jgi:hypothetical protein